MKIKIRPYEASILEEDWLATNDWLAKLRAMPDVEPPGDGPAEPASPGDSRPEAAVAAGAVAGAFPDADADAHADADADADAHADIADTETAVRAVIGDQLRMPAMCCEMGSCSSRHTDPAASGEADIRARAIAAGWRVDAFGRLACPRCQQADPAFRVSCPATLWSRHDAIAEVTRLAGPDIGRTVDMRYIPDPGRPAQGRPGRPAPNRMAPQAAWRTS